MSHATTQNQRPAADDHCTRLHRQTDMLIDAIAGSARDQLEGLPVPVIYARLCAQLHAMGLVPAEEKVQRVAAWISGPEPTDHVPGNRAA